MSLYVSLENRKYEELFCANITHNMGRMCRAVSLTDSKLQYIKDQPETLYDILWNAREHEISSPKVLIDAISEGIDALVDFPEYFDRFNPSNGWGTRQDLIGLLRYLLQGFQEFPNALIVISK